MPALVAMINGNASGFNRELASSAITAKNWAKQLEKDIAPAYASVYTAADVKRITQAGEGFKAIGNSMGGASRGAMREMIVLVREMSRGNWSRVPGSASLLLQQSGLLALLPVVAVLVGFLWGLNKALKALSPAADTLGVKSLAVHMDHFREKTIEAKASVLEWADSLKHGRSEADRLNDSLQELSNTTEAWAAADEKVAAAKKELQMAQIKQAEQEGKITKEQAKQASDKIESDFDQAHLKRANDARGVMVKALFDAAKKEEGLAGEAKGKVPGLSDSYNSAQSLADANSERMKNAEANLKLLHQKREQLGAGGFAGMGGNAAVQMNQRVLDAASAAQPGLIAAAKGAKGELEKAEQDAIKLRESADSKRRDADMKMVKSAADYRADKEVAALKAQKRAIEEESTASGTGMSMRTIRGHLTSNQAIGAYASPASNVMIDTAKRSERHLATIVSLLRRNSPESRKASSGVRF